MAYAKKDDWDKPRRVTRAGLTMAELAIVEAGFKSRRPPREVGRELKCASRTVCKYYDLYRAEGMEQVPKPND